jgi:acyl-CoA synthetase (AMP-forming)/AMP-acid ligase II
VTSPPPTRFGGRLWTAAELDALAAGWFDELSSALVAPADVVATVIPSHPEGVALFFALSALPCAVAVLPEDPTGWRSEPPLPAGAPIVLPPILRHLAPAATARGHPAIALGERAAGRPSGDYRPLSFRGIVAFTTGSTGLPKPVCWSRDALFASSRAATLGLGLVPGDGILGALPLTHTHGLRGILVAAVVLGGPLGLLERFDHRSVLALFATGEYRHFPCTPFMADLLARCPLSGPTPPAPELVRVSSGRMSERTFRAFVARFGVPPRSGYGATESGIITQEAGHAEDVRWDSAGRAVPGAEVRIGDDPSRPFAPGRPGRLWFRTEACMDGYGFPPDLEPRERQAGWFATGDVGALDAQGRLTVIGRFDDRFKTAAGQIVDPAAVADALRAHPGVREVAVFPLAGTSGTLIGALVEGEASVEAGALRVLAGERLPPWARPQTLEVVSEIPRNRAGKIEREACIAILTRAGRDGQ